MSSYAYRLARQDKPELEILLHNHDDDYTYSTHDSVSGVVNLTVPTSTQLDQVLITLEGKTEAFVHMVSPVASETKIQATHTFLRLLMPLEDSDYPEDRILEAGTTYSFPFNFVLPEQLLPTACSHDVNAHHVQEAHLRLPPSVGEEATPSARPDDLAPLMARVLYTVHVKIATPPATPSEDGKPTILLEASKKLDVLPSIPEAPPLHVPADSEDYNLTATKAIRKGLLKGKLGNITLTAAQSKALVLNPGSPSSTPSTVVHLHLRFDPADHSSPPPKLGSLTTKIKALTFHSVKPLPDLATRSDLAGTASYDASRHVYHTNVGLGSRNVEAVSWNHIPATPKYVRRDSGYSTASSVSYDSSSSSSSTTSGRTPRAAPVTAIASEKGHYEATIIVPVALPSNRTWLPTFHSCLVSRIYALSLDLTVAAPGTSTTLGSSVGLKLPVQIASLSRLGAPAVVEDDESPTGSQQSDRTVRRVSAERSRSEEEEEVEELVHVDDELYGPDEDPLEMRRGSASTTGSGRSSGSSGRHGRGSRSGRGRGDNALPPDYEMLRSAGRATRGVRART